MMKSVEEHEVFAALAGMPLSAERLREIAVYEGKASGEYADCEEYHVENLPLTGRALRQRFRLTDALLSRWQDEGILFRIRLFLRDGVLIGGRIFKFRLSPKGFSTAGYETDPTRQEIRLTARILSYLIAAEAPSNKSHGGA